ncbi:MAG: hypothetical protein LBV72_19770 [Tannerella sp.]|jgi:uncharacterized membrane protein|nr:hypothetical protein [Tannerella sp.]
MNDKREISYLIIACMVLLLMFSCKAKQQVIAERIDSVYIERLIPITLPTDSASIKALLECNANGRVVLSQLRTESTRNAYLTFLLDSLGNLQMETIVKYDTIYVKSDSVRVSEVITQYEYIEKQLGKWDSFILRFGNWMFGALCCFVIGAIVIFVLKKRIRS